MFKSFLTVLCAGAIFFAPSLASAAVEIWNLFYADDYEESISAESMLNLSVESFNGPWGDVLKMSMDIKDNQGYGWKYIAGDTAGKEAYSWVLWQNAYKDTTYALSCAGTDSPFDIATFLPMMVDEDYSEQMNAAIESVKNIKNIIPTSKIEKLYITGHSLGGYLAMFLGTELVEASVNPALSDLPFSTTFGEKGIGLTMDDISIVTFGAPGFYKTRIKFADNVVKFLE
jgi:hypothetical protein